MVRPSPALTSVAWTVELATLLEMASLAIGRLDARVSASSVAPAWRLRAAWSGYARALQLQSVEIDEIDVCSWGCGLVLPRRAPRSSVGDAFAAFVPWLTALAARGGTGARICHLPPRAPTTLLRPLTSSAHSRSFGNMPKPRAPSSRGSRCRCCCTASA